MVLWETFPHECWGSLNVLSEIRGTKDRKEAQRDRGQRSQGQRKGDRGQRSGEREQGPQWPPPSGVNLKSSLWQTYSRWSCELCVRRWPPLPRSHRSGISPCRFSVHSLSFTRRRRNRSEIRPKPLPSTYRYHYPGCNPRAQLLYNLA